MLAPLLDLWLVAVGAQELTQQICAVLCPGGSFLRGMGGAAEVIDDLGNAKKDERGDQRRDQHRQRNQYASGSLAADETDYDDAQGYARDGGGQHAEHAQDEGENWLAVGAHLNRIMAPQSGKTQEQGILLPVASPDLSLRIMNRFATLLIFAAALAGGLTGCQTTSNIAPHYEGAKWKRLSSSSAVQTGRLPEKNLDAHIKQREKQGYIGIGKAFFTGQQQGLSQLKSFAASVGSDFVEGLVVPVGKEQRSYMGISSYTPGRTITSLGASSGYASGSSSGTISSPYGPMSFNTQGSGTSFGTAAASTYVPPEITYAPKTYEVLVTQQMYIFWLSPAGVLRNWPEMVRETNAIKPAAERISDEETKFQAAIFAQVWRVPLPANLRPRQPVPQLSEKELSELRTKLSKAPN